jgi:transcriptional regulator with XRE-family HTH domain
LPCHPVLVNFGPEVRRRRKALGLTLEELAERAGLTPNYLGTVETGKRDPSLSTVYGVAKGLRVPPADLFAGSASIGPAGVEAGRLFESAPPDVQEAVLVVLRAVARRRR